MFLIAPAFVKAKEETTLSLAFNKSFKNFQSSFKALFLEM